MPQSHTIVIEIDHPLADTYRYLADPRTYADWAAIDPGTWRPVGGGDWGGQTRFGGLRHVRFTPPNDQGVLDHAVFVPGEEPLWMPMRVAAKGKGTELRFTFLQRPGMSDEAFASAIEWITTDFLALKSLLEARRR